MKKLEEIEKKDIFEVPDGYFESLPSVIQARVTKSKDGLIWLPQVLTGLKYALPVLAIAVSALWFFKPTPTETPEDILASINSEDLAEYINSMEISNDDFLDYLDYSQVNADSLDLHETHVVFDEDVDLSDLIDLETEI